MKKTIRLNEAQLRKAVSESVKRILKETELDYDMDNFSGKWNRGNRYDILVDGEVYYHDIPEESVDKLYNDLSRRYENVEVVDLNDEPSADDSKPIRQWNDVYEKEYEMIAMIKSDMNPIQIKVTANSIQEAIGKATEKFARYSRYGAKDVDIYYVNCHEYDGF